MGNNSENYGCAITIFAFFLGWTLLTLASNLGGKEDYKIELLNQKQVEITTKDGEKYIISVDSIQQFINKTQL